MSRELSNTPYIDVVLAGDDNVARCLATAMLSICETTATPKQLRFHVLHQMSVDSHERIAVSVPRVVTLEFVDGASEIADLTGGLGRISDVTSAMWLRAFAADLLPEVDKAIYVDSDTLCRADISELYAKDLSGAPVGAVTDFYSTFGDAGLEGHYGEIAVLGNEQYFNSGVLLCDFVQWRQDCVSERVRELALKFGTEFKYPDQDALNLAFKDQWVDVCGLSPGEREEWNNRKVSRLTRTGAPAEEIERELQNAKLIHFTTPFKPWREQYPAGVLQDLYLDVESRGGFAHETLEPFTAAGWHNGIWQPTSEETGALPSE